MERCEEAPLAKYVVESWLGRLDLITSRLFFFVKFFWGACGITVMYIAAILSTTFGCVSRIYYFPCGYGERRPPGQWAHTEAASGCREFPNFRWDWAVVVGKTTRSGLVI